ncbi:MAG TPA: TadE/TadG family type IV pilus assembly protein [Nocardioides sp.]|nr:TadE/TadG family type IV pilus assembly protein [Nocardioides sp.]
MARSECASAPFRRSGRRGADRGASAVEFALVVPFLLLIIFGIIAFGMMLSFRQTLSQAATEGARAGALSSGTSATARGVVANSAASDALGALKVGGTTLSCTAANVTCTYTEAPCTNDASHTCSTLTVSYPYRNHPMLSLPFVNMIMPSTLSYSATAREN